MTSVSEKVLRKPRRPSALRLAIERRIARLGWLGPYWRASRREWLVEKDTGRTITFRRLIDIMEYLDLWEPATDD